MNLGLGNRIELKRHLLAAGIVAETTYDVAVDAVGLGVARQFEKFCNRKFERTVGAVQIFGAQRIAFSLERFPVESVASVELRDDMTGGWVAQTLNDVVSNRNDEAGLLHFGTTLGSDGTMARVTYTGGYWFDTTEDGSGAQPGGSTKLPEDVKLAWLIQCKEFWNKRDPLGLSLVKGEQTTFVSQMLMQLDLIPVVTRMLRGFVRYQMT